MDWLQGPIGSTECITGAVDCAWFLRAFWIERMAKILQFLSAAVILVEILGPTRIDAYAEQAKAALTPFTPRDAVRKATGMFRVVWDRVRHEPFDDSVYLSGKPLGCILFGLNMVLLGLWTVSAGSVLSELVEEKYLLSWHAVVILVGGAFIFPWLFLILFAYAFAVGLGLIVLLTRTIIAIASATALSLLRRKPLSELALFASFWFVFVGFVLELLIS